MSRVVVNEVVPATTKEVVKAVICDLCLNSVNEAATYGPTVKWIRSAHMVLETTVALTEGNAFPEGGSSETTYVDLCPTCFRKKLLPWLQSQGVKIRSIVVDT